MTVCRRRAPSNASQIGGGAKVADRTHLGLTPGNSGKHQVAGRRLEVGTNRLDDDRTGHAAQGRINAVNGKRCVGLPFQHGIKFGQISLHWKRRASTSNPPREAVRCAFQ